MRSSPAVVEALRDTVATIRLHHPEQPCTVLVADGGSENHAVCVEELLRETHPPDITKVIALKDIAPSPDRFGGVRPVLQLSH